MKDIGNRPAPLTVAVLLAAVLGAGGCEFYSPEYENPLDPSVSVSREDIDFADPVFRGMVEARADGPTTNDVEYIDGDGQGVSSLEGIQYLSNLRELRFWGESSVSSLAPVGELRRLEVLQLDNANVTDLSPLSAVDSLRELSVRQNNIASLEPLQGLSNLERLGVSGPNDWSDKHYRGGVAGVAALTQLREVEIQGFEIENEEDLSPVLTMPNLRGLWLSNSLLTTFPTNTAILRLERLDLSWNPITALPDTLVTFPNLTYLGIQSLELEGDGNYSRLSNISAPALEYIRLGGNRVEDQNGDNTAPTTRIPNLSQFPELRRLGVRDSQLTDISGLSSLTGLEELEISSQTSDQSTGISDFSPLQSLSRLQWIGLGDSGFGDGDVQYLSGKSDLHGVSAWDNEGLVTLAGFASIGLDYLDVNGLPNLTTLNLSYIDHIRHVMAHGFDGGGPLETVTGGTGAGIEILELTDQSIGDVTALGNLSTLRRLQLGGNPITNGVRSLARLTNLQYLDLTGTGVSAEDITYLREELPNTVISR